MTCFIVQKLLCQVPARVKSQRGWLQGPQVIIPQTHRFIIRLLSLPVISVAPPLKANVQGGGTVSDDLLGGNLTLKEFFSSLPHCKIQLSYNSSTTCCFSLAISACLKTLIQLIMWSYNKLEVDLNMTLVLHPM